MQKFKNLYKQTLKFKSNTSISESVRARLIKASQSEVNSVYEMLETGAMGISNKEADERLLKFGLNELDRDKPLSWLKQLKKSFTNPFVFILVAIAVISWIIYVRMAEPGEQDYKTVTVISVIIFISTLLGFFQEYRSNRAAEKLKSMIKTTAAVARESTDAKEIPINQVVPGDIIKLSAGDMIPADCRIVECTDLFVGESMLTGESVPAEKTNRPQADAESKQVISLLNLCFMGTNVISGSAKAVAITTGSETYLGSISKAVTRAGSETGFDIGIKRVSYLLIRFMLLMVLIIFLINGLLKGEWMESLLFSIAVAIGLTPEMLPVIVTANLAKGALSMSKQRVIVKQLSAMQNIGAMDILCTDKTGTLTLDKIVLENHLNVLGQEDEEVLKWAYLNSYYQTGLKNLMDLAVLEHVEVKNYLKVEDHFSKIDEIPFDFQRRRMSVILRQKNGKHLLICKGAVEEMIHLCSHSFEPGEDRQLHIERDTVVSMDSQMRKKVLDASMKMNQKGLRVLLLGIREFDGNRSLNYSVADESNLTFAGFIGFLDPAKPSARPSIHALQQLNVKIKVVTGDNEIITAKICKDVGIPVQNILLGDELELISDNELTERIDDISIFAKVNPLQKNRIVRSLQAKGHTVGFLGDGINDAPGLKEADVGITVDTAVDIAKESSDIILLEKELMVLRSGVIQGRKTFGNIIKYIKLATSSNFGNVLSLVGASFFFPFLPLAPIQILVQNLLYDVSQTSIPWDKMDEDFLERPKKWDALGIQKFMVHIGPVSSVFDYLLFAVMFFVFKANSPENQSLFQTGWFVEGLLSQTLIVHIIRTKKIPFVQSWASAPVIALTSLITVIGIALPFTPFAEALNLQPLPPAYFGWLTGILIMYSLLTHYVKKWYIRKYSQWL